MGLLNKMQFPVAYRKSDLTTFKSLKIIKHYTAVFHIRVNPGGFALHMSVYNVSYICKYKGGFYSSY